MNGSVKTHSLFIVVVMIVIDSLLPVCLLRCDRYTPSESLPRDRRERVIRGARLAALIILVTRNHRTGNWQLGRKEPLEEKT